MDIDEFLDREFSELGLQTGETKKPETSIEMPALKEQSKPSSLFEDIKASLSKGNLEQAEHSYIQVWGILTQQKLKWSKELYGQLLDLSRQFSNTLSSVYNEIKIKADRINELINRAKALFREGKKEQSFKIYAEIDEIFNSIPNVFFEEKKMLQDQITGFYKDLKGTTTNELVKRVSALIQEINQLIDKANLLIKSNDITNAIMNYDKCIELYNQIPEGFLRHKNSAGIRLLEIYKSLSIYAEISNLQQQLGQQPNQRLLQFQQQTRQQTAPNLFAQINQQMISSTKSMLLKTKKEHAKKNIEKGFYNEASKDIQEALQIDPNDAEAKVINAKIKTLQ